MASVPRRGIRYGPRRYVARPALHAVIKEQRRNQAALARSLRLSESYLSRLVRGQRPIAEPDARALAAILGLGSARSSRSPSEPL